MGEGLTLAISSFDGQMSLKNTFLPSFPVPRSSVSKSTSTCASSQDGSKKKPPDSAIMGNFPLHKPNDDEICKGFSIKRRCRQLEKSVMGPAAALILMNSAPPPPPPPPKKKKKKKKDWSVPCQQGHMPPPEEAMQDSLLWLEDAHGPQSSCCQTVPPQQLYLPKCKIKV